MPIQLTAEQEQRIQAVVDGGGYRSAEEALDAALSVVESAATPRFDGTDSELESLLLDGLRSKDLTEDEFWESADLETNSMLAAHKARPPA